MTDQSASPSRARIIIAFAAIYLVWGSTYLAIRYAVDTLPPFLMAGTRFLVSGGAMYLWARSRGAAKPTRANWHAATIVGGLLLLGGNGGVVWAEQRIPSGLAALLVATAPIWMVLFQWALGGQRPTNRVWAGLVVGFLGLGILVGPADLFGGGAVDGLGAAAVTFAAISWAFGSVVSGRVPLAESPFMATATEMLGGGTLLVLLGSVLGEWNGLALDSVSWQSWAGLLYLILVGSFIGFSAYVWLLRHVDVAKVSTYAYVNPVVAVFLGWLIASEPLTHRTLLAAAVIVAAVVVITTGRRGGRVKSEG